MMEKAIVVTAHAVYVPDLDLYHVPGGAGDNVLHLEQDQVPKMIGRKGLLNKEAATKLALAVVHHAFKLPAGPPGEADDPDGTAVVVSSNLGNVESVCEIVGSVRADSLHDISPMSVPNVSSNIIASTIAIRHGWRGPNLMICNGETSGLDAVSVAARLLRAGRARRVVVVGVEPCDETSSQLRDGLRAAAACVVLEQEYPPGPDSIVLQESWIHPKPENDAIADRPSLSFVPRQTHFVAPDDMVDLHDALGDTFGALGVLQLALACEWLEELPHAYPERAVVTCGAPRVGYRSALLARGVVA